MSHLLFAYGTLAPSDHASAEGWSADAVRGRLYDLGPYPAVFDLDDPEAGWVVGFVRETNLDELAGDLDTYEGVAEGLFIRRRIPHKVGPRGLDLRVRWDAPTMCSGPYRSLGWFKTS